MVEIIAHRGASARAPENTLAAFSLAWEDRADGIEIDVHLSRDGRVMVHHDEHTRRSAGVDLDIARTDSAVLRGLDVGRWFGEAFAGERMPFLEEALALVPPGRRALVEIKCGPGIVPALQTALDGVDRRLRLGLISMNLDTLVAARAVLARFPCYLVAECAMPEEDGVRPLHPHDWVEIAVIQGFAGIDAEHRGIDAAFAAAVCGAGLELLTWTVNDGPEARRLRDLGVEAITTDRPEEIRQALRG